MSIRDENWRPTGWNPDPTFQRKFNAAENHKGLNQAMKWAKRNFTRNTSYSLDTDSGAALSSGDTSTSSSANASSTIASSANESPAASAYYYCTSSFMTASTAAAEPSLDLGNTPRSSWLFSTGTNLHITCQSDGYTKIRDAGPDDWLA